MLFLKLKREGEFLIFMGSSFHCFAPSTVVVVVVLLFYVHGKHLRSCRDGPLT